MGPATTRSVPPAVVDGARTPVTPASGPPPWTGTSTVPLAPPLQLTARTTTRTTTESPPSSRCPDRPRAQPGTRSRTLPPAPPPAAVQPGGGQPPSAAIGQIDANSSASRLAPPTRAPSMSGPARIPAVLPALPDPP